MLLAVLLQHLNTRVLDVSSHLTLVVIVVILVESVVLGAANLIKFTEQLVELLLHLLVPLWRERLVCGLSHGTGIIAIEIRFLLIREALRCMNSGRPRLFASFLLLHV